MSAAEKMLGRMQASLNGWGQDDFRRLYIGFGFEESGTKHCVYIHSKHPHLRATVGRHNSLATGYASHAIKLIEQLKVLEQEETNA